MLPLYLCHLSLQTTGGKNEVRKGLKLSLVYLDLLDLGYAVQSLKWKNKAEKMNTQEEDIKRKACHGRGCQGKPNIRAGRWQDQSDRDDSASV